MVFFDKTNYYETSSNYTPSTNVSICFWIRPTENTGGTKYRFFGSDNAFELRLLNEKIESDLFEGGGTPLIGATSIFLWTWYHVVVTRASNSDSYIFVNGVQDGYRVDGNDTPSVAKIQIGSSPVSAERFEGYLEDFRIYNRVLTLNEIKTMYSAEGADFLYDGLIHRWVFDEGTFNAQLVTIYDRVGTYDLTQQKTSTNYPQMKEIKNNYKRQAIYG